jgi:hypothetical protein
VGHGEFGKLERNKHSNSTRIPQLGLTKSASTIFHAAKSIGLCLSAFIEQRCFEGMLELHRDGVVEGKSF